MAFVKASKKKSKLRLALCGVSGSGKTYSALLIAKHLGARVAVIDTERGSASKYAGDVADFDVCELETFEPRKYIAALNDAAKEGFDVVVIDSLSHGWMGAGGIIDQKDKKGGNSFDAWRTLTPQHNEFVEAILSYPGHVIATMRSKTEYVVEKDSNGKSVPRKIGMAPVQRDGVEYEFDVVGDLDVDHVLHVTKSRCAAIAGEYIRNPGERLAKTLLAWLEQGAEEDVEAAKAARQAKQAAADAEAAAKTKADEEQRERAQKAKAEADALRAQQLAATTAAAVALAEQMLIEDIDDAKLRDLRATITSVVGASEKLKNALVGLAEQVQARIKDETWVPVDATQQGAVVWLRAEVLKAQEARKTQQTQTAA